MIDRSKLLELDRRIAVAEIRMNRAADRLFDSPNQRLAEDLLSVATASVWALHRHRGELQWSIELAERSHALVHGRALGVARGGPSVSPCEAPSVGACALQTFALNSTAASPSHQGGSLGIASTDRRPDCTDEGPRGASQCLVPLGRAR